MLLPTVSGKSWICQVLLFIFSRDTSPIGNKTPDREFHWSTAHEFCSCLRIWNCKSACSAGKFVRKLVLLREIKGSLEKIVTPKGIFSREWKSSKKKQSLVYKMHGDIQNSAIKDRHEFHVKTHKDLEMLILPTPILPTNKFSLRVALL